MMTCHDTFFCLNGCYQSWQRIHIVMYEKNHRVFWAEIHSSDLECILN